MATWQKEALRLYRPGDPALTAHVDELPEGSAQTFKKNSLVKLSAGQIIARTSGAADECFAFVLDDATGTQGTLLRCIILQPGDCVEGNFLATGGGNGTLAADDIGKSFELELDATLLGTGKPGWYIADAVATPSVRCISFHTNSQLPNALQGDAVAGDINARVRAVILRTLLPWGA